MNDMETKEFNELKKEVTELNERVTSLVNKIDALKGLVITNKFRAESDIARIVEKLTKL